MDVAHPIRAAVPTLDGPILEVLARTTRPLTGREVQRLVVAGSVNGVRLALARLARQGLVRVEERAKTLFYQANRDHLAWPAVEQLAHLRRALIDQLRDEFGKWSPPPVHASLYGSAARGDGDADSDIDLLVIRPAGCAEDVSPWAEQVDHIRSQVESWTGNHCQVFQLDLARLAEHRRANDPIVDDWQRDAVTLAGPDMRVLLRGLPTGDSR
ncbi:MAG: nucleotidyltransferase domain-containing protein [Natronosporangium sp.]